MLLGDMVLDVPDPEHGIDKAQAERELAARVHGRPVMIVVGPSDVDAAIKLTR